MTWLKQCWLFIERCYQVTSILKVRLSSLNFVELLLANRKVNGSLTLLHIIELRCERSSEKTKFVKFLLSFFHNVLGIRWMDTLHVDDMSGMSPLSTHDNEDSESINGSVDARHVTDRSTPAICCTFVAYAQYSLDGRYVWLSIHIVWMNIVFLLCQVFTIETNLAKNLSAEVHLDYAKFQEKIMSMPGIR